MTEAQADIESFKRALAALEEFRIQVRESYREIEGMKHSADDAAALRTELEQIRGVAGQLGDDYARLRDASREARESSAATAEVVHEVERKLGWLGQRVNEIQTTLDAETQRRDEFVQETARMEKDGRALAATIETYVERFALDGGARAPRGTGAEVRRVRTEDEGACRPRTRRQGRERRTRPRASDERQEQGRPAIYQ